MTTNEKKLQKAQLIVDSQDAAEELAHLRERSFRKIQDIREMVNWMENQTTDESSPFIETALIDARFQSASDFNAILKLMGEIKKARQDVWNLELRRKALGIILS